MYERGRGLAQDYKMAFKWYAKAGEQGYAKAQYNLGVMYERGHGVPQDEKKAVRLYTQAAEKGDI